MLGATTGGLRPPHVAVLPRQGHFTTHAQLGQYVLMDYMDKKTKTIH